MPMCHQAGAACCRAAGRPADVKIVRNHALVRADARELHETEGHEQRRPPADDRVGVHAEQVVERPARAERREREAEDEPAAELRTTGAVRAHAVMWMRPDLSRSSMFHLPPVRAGDGATGQGGGCASPRARRPWDEPSSVNRDEGLLQAVECECDRAGLALEQHGGAGASSAMTSQERAQAERALTHAAPRGFAADGERARHSWSAPGCPR